MGRGRVLMSPGEGGRSEDFDDAGWKNAVVWEQAKRAGGATGSPALDSGQCEGVVEAVRCGSQHTVGAAICDGVGDV